MVCKLCQTSYEGTACPYCGMPALGDLGGGGSVDSFCAEHRARLVSSLSSLKAVVYRYENGDGGVKETEETVVLADLGRADGQTVWSETEFLRLEPDDLEDGSALRLSLRAEGKGLAKDFSVELPLPKAEGLWRVGIRLEKNLTLTVLVGTPEEYSEAAGIRFLA
ncbi:MAG TPA: hypothetical protein IAB55_08160 [Candidatus Merdivicinus faecavium]|nr:hypothetical protein [Candidatus Merdivicinus faecavium]